MKEKCTLKKKINIKIMCDYSADGIWINNKMSNIKHLPKKLQRLEIRIRKWQDTFENFQFYLKSNLQKRLLKKTLKYNNFIKEGYKISKIIRKNLGIKYNVNYFDSSKNKSIRLEKSKVKF